MAKLNYQGEVIEVSSSSTVLESLLNAGYSIPHSCQEGICHSCLMQATEGTIPKHAQQGLCASEIDQNFFLSCQCVLDGPMSVCLPNESTHKIPAHIKGWNWLNDSILELNLEPLSEFSYEAGQYITLWNDLGLARPYSISSVPNVDLNISLTIKIHEKGQMSQWLKHHLSKGQSLWISTPMGDCIYPQASAQDELILIGRGTGLGPLYGVVKQALHNGHTGQIILAHLGQQADDFYLDASLSTLQNEVSNFEYWPIQLASSFDLKFLDAFLKEKATPKVFLCGDPKTVKGLQKECFLKGVSLSHIFADSFVSRKIPQQPSPLK